MTVQPGLSPHATRDAAGSWAARPFGASRAKRLAVFATVLLVHGVALAFLTLSSDGTRRIPAPRFVMVGVLASGQVASVPKPEVPAGSRRSIRRTATARPHAIDVPTPSVASFASKTEETHAPGAADPEPPQSTDTAAIPVQVMASSASESGSTVSPATSIVEADYLSNPPPEYPSVSRALGEQGLVSLRIHVSMDGVPDVVELYQSSGHRRLDDAAIAAVWRWRFVPARQEGRDIAGWAIVPIRFMLRG